MVVGFDEFVGDNLRGAQQRLSGLDVVGVARSELLEERNSDQYFSNTAHVGTVVQIVADKKRFIGV